MNAAPDDETHWMMQRDRMALEPGTINFNTGTCGPVPSSIQAAVESLRARLYNAPSDFCWRQLPVRLNYARTRLAEYLNADPADLLLLSNVTIALNLAVWSLDLPVGSEVLTTDHEYGAMRFLLEHAGREKGWTVRVATLPYESDDPAELTAALTAAVRPATRLLFFSHTTSPTGLILPAEDLCRMARERNIVSVVDGAHSPGTTPVDLRAIGADFYGANCHKWLLAPLGAAFLHVRSDFRATVAPRITSWGWEFASAQFDVDSGWGGAYWTRNLEFQGTTDRCSQCVLPEVLDFRRSLGDEAVFLRQKWLSERVRERFADIGLKPAVSANLSAGLTVFPAPPVDPVRARDYLWNNYRLEAPFTTAAGHWFWRISTAWFNSIAEIDRLTRIAATLPFNDLQ